MNFSRGGGLGDPSPSCIHRVLCMAPAALWTRRAVRAHRHTLVPPAQGPDHVKHRANPAAIPRAGHNTDGAIGSAASAQHLGHAAAVGSSLAAGFAASVNPRRRCKQLSAWRHCPQQAAPARALPRRARGSARHSPRPLPTLNYPPRHRQSGMETGQHGVLGPPGPSGCPRTRRSQRDTRRAPLAAGLLRALGPAPGRG